MPTHTRVCIVGGGITGTSTALHIAQHPHVQVHLYNTGQFPGGPCTSSHLDANQNQTSKMGGCFTFMITEGERKGETFDAKIDDF